MRSHYAVVGTIRYYHRPAASVELRGDHVLVDEGFATSEPFDLEKWKEPPHVALANLRDDAEALLPFTRRYGRVFDRPASSGVVHVWPRDAVRFRDALQRAWRANEMQLAQMLVDLKTSVIVQPSGLDIVVEDLWTLVRLLFLRDWRAGRTRVCVAGPDCPAPYFVAVRKGQKFCSHRCAVLVNVRRFRKRQANQQAAKKSQRRSKAHLSKPKKA